MGKSAAKAYIYTHGNVCVCAWKAAAESLFGAARSWIGDGWGERLRALGVAPAARGIWPFFSLHAQHSRSAFFRVGSNFLLLSPPITLAALTAL